MPALCTTLEQISDPGTDIFIAHGRNRQAEGAFLRRCSTAFLAEEMLSNKLHKKYQTSDVRVLRLSKVTR